MHLSRMVVFALFLSFAWPAQAEYICEGVDDCQQRWWRVSSWLEEHSKFKVKQRGEHRLQAKAKTPAYKTRLQYDVEKQLVDGERWRISAQASCRVSTGCPNAEKKLAQLFAYIAQPLEAVPADADSLKQPVLGAIDLHLREEGCEQQSPVHPLRTSWAGTLYEVECFVDVRGEQRESLVVRCRGEQCRSLR